MKANRPVYTITVRADPHVDPIRALRRGLKFLGRACGLRAVTVREYPAEHAAARALHANVADPGGANA
jgi:hypothetical protein